MNSRRHAFALAGALTATALTSAVAVAGFSHHPTGPEHAAPARRPGRALRRPSPAAQLGGRLMRRVWATVVSVWATLAIVAASPGRATAGPPARPAGPRPPSSSRARTGRRSG